jgi:hypothetical protein
VPASGAAPVRVAVNGQLADLDPGDTASSRCKTHRDRAVRPMTGPRRLENLFPVSGKVPFDDDKGSMTA